MTWQEYNTALDDAICEGLLLAAMWLGETTGWKPQLLRHLQLRVVLAELKAREKVIEFADR